ncbi:hypothetical protein ACLOJK_036772 [Asimina triloba]
MEDADNEQQTTEERRLREGWFLYLGSSSPSSKAVVSEAKRGGRCACVGLERAGNEIERATSIFGDSMTTATTLELTIDRLSEEKTEKWFEIFSNTMELKYIIFRALGLQRKVRRYREIIG